jgi:DNA-binding transcriptional LysR family regulator
VDLILRELTTDQQVNALQKGSVHVGFLRQPVKDDALHVETVLREPFSIALPKDHPLAAHTHVALKTLVDEPFVMFSRHGLFYDQVMRLCNQAGFSPKVAQEAINASTILGLVSVGIGIACIPACLEELQMEGVIYRVLTGITQHTELAIARRRDDKSPVLVAFISVVKAISSQMQTRKQG